ncbi:hypothetical protein I309_03111 [Cryptococcus deuterogattii LA55]|nr:hypothetical protein I309_03111 [Cryptococcus deuterogattii LA55]KIR90681.1 hypothetical protein I304_05330 [Cryptococcus deuterogattii CBS 10090]KIR97579.1 hypothetical protein L804_05266 [Cryptococcus deuterogattii 2001/935-1]
MLLFLLLFLPSLLFVTSSAITRTSTSGCSKTILGFTATGYKTSDGACRYTVRYGKADRWGDSVLVTDYRLLIPFRLPVLKTLGPTLPVAANRKTVYLQLYTCLRAMRLPAAGPLLSGGASAPGLNGSKLAAEGDMIVVVLQYRLGVLGFLPPTSANINNDPNLGLKDVILGLKAINQYIEYAGGNRAEVTIGGQSSGAALWGASAAADQSYGFASHDITTNIQYAFYSTSPMSSCSTLECLKNIHVSTLIAAQDTIVTTVPFTVRGVPFSEPAALVGADRAGALVSSPYYALPSANSSDSYGPDGDTFRETFERAVTDGTWKCPNRDAALKWKEAGGKIWVGEWMQGVSYPDNDSGYCQKTGVVCHEDDIYPTFGTASSTSTSTLDFESAILSHWVAFITTLNPNPPSSSTKRACAMTTQFSHDSHDSHNSHDSHGHGSNWWERSYTQWEEYNSQTDVYPLGGDSKSSLCPDGFWGVEAKYDWQLYG